MVDVDDSGAVDANELVRVEVFFEMPKCFAVQRIEQAFAGRLLIVCDEGTYLCS